MVRPNRRETRVAERDVSGARRENPARVGPKAPPRQFRRRKVESLSRLAVNDASHAEHSARFADRESVSRNARNWAL